MTLVRGLLSLHKKESHSKYYYIYMDPIYRQFMVRRLAAVKQRCYIEIFKLIVEHKVAYTVNRNGVFFNMSPLSDKLVRQIDEILKRCEQRKQDSTN